MNQRERPSMDDSYREAEAVLERLATAGIARRKLSPVLTASPEELEAELATLGDDSPALTLDVSTLCGLLESLPDAVVVSSITGGIVLVNARTERLFDYSRSELMGRPIEMLIASRGRRALAGYRKGYSTASGSRASEAKLELPGLRRDGSEFPIEVGLSPLFTEEGRFAVGVIRDISPRKREEAKFRTLVENIPAVTFIAPLDESIPELYVSPQIEQLLGFSQKEWLEDPVLWHRQLHPDDQERWNREFAPTCAGGESFRSIYRFIAKDGRVVWIHGSASVVHDGDGLPMFLQGVAFDISSIKEAEEERDRFFSLSIDLFCIAGLDGRFHRINEAFSRTLGFSTSELLRSPFLDLMHPDDRPFAEREFRKVSRGVTATFEARVRCKDDSYKWLEWTATPYLSQKVMFAVARDVTERKRGERQLREFNEILEQRVSERTEALERQSEELKLLNQALVRSNQDLDDFAHITSHDLKEPLRGIGNYAGFLMEDYAERLDEAGKNRLRTMIRLSAHMTDLLDGLLQFSRVGRAELAVGPTDLNDILARVLDSLQLLLQEQNASIRIPTPLPIVACDRIRIGEIFRNLITNAVKYNDKEAKRIEIGFRSANASDRTLTFYVRDNGIGIREKHQDAVFRMFKRLHARDKFGGGTGVGLTIVKKIVERHGGRIWIESEFGVGTTFFFTLEESPKRESQRDASDSGGGG